MPTAPKTGPLILAVFLCGCASTSFRAVDGDVLGRPCTFPERGAEARKADGGARRGGKILVSAEELFAEKAPVPPPFDSAEANEAVKADNAGDFARAYAIVSSNASPICRALLANYTKYSRPGLDLKPDAAATDAICREIIAAVPAEPENDPQAGFYPHPRVSDDIQALREAWRLLSFADYAGLCSNVVHACIPPNTRFRFSDLFYDGGPFAAFVPYPFWGADEIPVANFDRRLREAAIRGNERARRAFSGDSPPDGAILEYHRQGVIRFKRFAYLPLDGAPGFGLEGHIEPYSCTPSIEERMRSYGFEAHWFHVGHPAQGDPARNVFAEKVRAYSETSTLTYQGTSFGCENATPERIPFLLRRAASGRKRPLVIYMPGNGEQGTDLELQFRQRAVMDKVSSREFQKRHPCHLLIPMPPSYGNRGMDLGYPVSPGGDLNNAYCDLVFQLMREGLAVDRSRIYLVGLGSGGSTAIAMALDHPGRFAAVCAMWAMPITEVFHPDSPGNWWFGEPSEIDDKKNRPLCDAIVDAIAQAGGDAVLEFYGKPEKGCWWDPPWQDDRFWDWLFAKTTKGEAFR